MIKLWVYIYIYIYIHTSHHGHVTPVKMAILKKSIKGKKMSTKGPPRCSPVVKGLCFHRRGYGHHPWPERQGPACCVAHPKKEKNKPQNDTNEHTRETETDSQNRLWLLRMDRRTGSLGLVTCTLLYAECINEALLYHTGNDIHYPVINQKRTWKSIHQYKSLCCTTEIYS